MRTARRAEGTDKVTPSPPRSVHFSDFRLSITKALGDQLAESLDKLTPAPLTTENLDCVERTAGVYQLYHREELVYVGKADQPLPSRIHQHLRKVSGRRNISLQDMKFTCLYVAEDFSALAPERLLIKTHRKNGLAIWNNNGFGNKDPGKRRDETLVKENHFDALYPIDVDRKISGLPSGKVEVGELLIEASKRIPYTFRYDKKGHSKSFRGIVDSSDTLSIDQVFRLTTAALPEDWQITILPGRAIMYPEPRIYPSALSYYRRGAATEVTPQYGEAGLITEESEDDTNSS
ncbi:MULTISPECIES: Eco29kI family restriction endonuclease [Actinoalloteichus]|uniref:Eco29kI family restriction endonuclease n=1 Tax=Actinoalloteichus TaxID=65496 RepID=UPI001B809F5D|nr:Eco29kI family restriction endonuclease [Actinoalloteichus caeruleus]